LLAYAGYLAQVAKRAGLGLDAYPQLKAYTSRQSDLFPAEVDNDMLYAEFKTRERSLRAQLYRSEAERELDALLERLEVVEKLVNISAAPDDPRSAGASLASR